MFAYRNILKFFTFLVCSFLGGVFSNYFLLTAGPALAAQFGVENYFALKDSFNSKGLESYVYNGYPAQNFYGKDGRIRLQFGIYNAPGEDGLPLIVLSDNRGDIKMLLRLAGVNESPVLIMKDNEHRDRIVLGLGLNDPGEEPFLATFDSSGTKRMIFGSY